MFYLSIKYFRKEKMTIFIINTLFLRLRKSNLKLHGKIKTDFSDSNYSVLQGS